jgi:hypothetical protein
MAAPIEPQILDALTLATRGVIVARIRHEPDECIGGVTVSGRDAPASTPMTRLVSNLTISHAPAGGRPEGGTQPS